MKTRLEQILGHCLNGRKIAVWGNPSLSLIRELKAYDYEIADKVNREKYYIVAVNDDDLHDFLRSEQSECFRDVEDYISFSDIGKELPFEWEYCGTRIGKQTYFGTGVAEACEDGYIESIGSYTSISGKVAIQGNHQLNMVFTSDELKRFFTDKNKEIFEKRCLTDKGCPYGKGKRKIIIGNDVWIGANAFINCSKVTNIGDGAVIGTGAVVLHDVPPYAVVAGVPAKIIRYRFEPEMIDILLRSEWWNWSVDKINENADALMSPEIFKRRFGF